MKFTPKYIDENVNVSKIHPLAELAWLVGGMLLLALVFYLVLGVTADLAVAKIPIKAEVWLGEHFVDSFEANEDEALQRRLQTLLDDLPAESPLHQYTFTVQLVKNEEVNALALPGGHIVVFSGLVEQAESENELAMVLAHELGHFAHRDHLKRLGRGLGLTVAAMLVFGEDSAISRLVSNLFLVTESSYSRQQEADADRFGLELLVNSYGHAGGAIDFFARVGKKAGRRAPYWLASHPHPDARIVELQSLIGEKGYPVERITPLGDDLLGDAGPEQEPAVQESETAVDKQ